MDGFLDHLVQRVLGPRSDLRPRQTHRFEDRSAAQPPDDGIEAIGEPGAARVDGLRRTDAPATHVDPDPVPATTAAHAFVAPSTSIDRSQQPAARRDLAAPVGMPSPDPRRRSEPRTIEHGTVDRPAEPLVRLQLTGEATRRPPLHTEAHASPATTGEWSNADRPADGRGGAPVSMRAMRSAAVPGERVAPLARIDAQSPEQPLATRNTHGPQPPGLDAGRIDMRRPGVAVTQVRAPQEKPAGTHSHTVPLPSERHVVVAHPGPAATPMPRDEAVRSVATSHPRAAPVVPVPRPPAFAELVQAPRDRIAGTGPTVQVTIGRVEIRAAVAPPAAAAPARRTPANKPALSLADYLKRRTGARS